MRKVIVLFLIVGFWLSFNLTKVVAAEGTIIGSSAYAWGEKIGWINFLAAGSGITITDTGLTGYVWNPNYGWINLSPSMGGVKNTCAGFLSGHAWSGTVGWIDFSGVTINSSGKFTGMAGTASSTAGRINFDCTNCSVVTSWKPGCLTTASTTSSTTGGWAAPSCSAAKPGSAPVVLSATPGANSVTLTWSKANDPVTHYLIAYGTASGDIKYGNPNVGNVTSYTVRGLSGGTTYFFKVKAINDCTPGDYSNEVSAAPSGVFIEEGTPAEGFTSTTENPSQLFDIALIVDEPKITKGSDLKARVTFISFGSEITPVDMTFSVIDANGKEYYNSKDRTEIQTEGVFNKSFEGLELNDGKYTLILTTLYNTNVKDEFKQDFEVTSGVTPTFWSKILGNKLWLGIVGLIFILIFIWWIFILAKRRKKDEEEEKKTKKHEKNI